MVRLDVGDLVVLNPKGSLRLTPPDEYEGFYTGIVVRKATCRIYRRINYDVMWDDLTEVYGYYGDELKLVRKPGWPL